MQIEEKDEGGRLPLEHSCTPQCHCKIECIQHQNRAITDRREHSGNRLYMRISIHEEKREKQKQEKREEERE